MFNVISCIILAATLITPIGTNAETVNDEQFVQISVGDYVILTNKIYTMWEYANATEQGRVSLHGNRVSRTVDTESKTVTFVYADGYIFIERMKTQRSSAIVPHTNTTATATSRLMKRPKHMSDAQWKFIQENSIKKPRLVNAVFAPGGKVQSISSEDDK